MSAPALIDSVSATATSTSLVFGSLAGGALGGFGIISVLSYGGTDDWSVPAGWTALEADLGFGGGGGAAGSVAVFYKASLAAGDIDGITVTNAASHTLSGTLSAYSVGAAIFDNAAASNDCGQTPNVTTPAVDVDDEGLVVFALHQMTASADITPPGGVTERHDVANPVASTVRTGLYDVAPSGAQSGYTKTFTFAEYGGGIARLGQSVAISLYMAPVAPIVDTDDATDISGRHVTLNAHVNDGGADTTYHWEYGLTTGYGDTTDDQVLSADSGNTAVSIRTSADLDFGTTYHARCVATNSQGTTNGDDITFTTGDRPDVAYGCISGVLS